MIILSILLNFNAYLSLRVLAKQSVIRMRLLLRRSGSQCRFSEFYKIKCTYIQCDLRNFAKIF
ncbi:MAG: hypothetical protein JWO44_2133 [Bacteroidetes bacterium]|nr:hypothetical protein [Bacteroidota bacterium]